MHLPDFILFASDATRYGLWGGGLLTVSAFATWRENLRKFQAGQPLATPVDKAQGY